MDILQLMQWPAMLATIVATWLIASKARHRRAVGFWLFLAGNALWVVWGWHTQAWALIAMQFALAGLNLRGVQKTEDPAA